MGFRLFKHRRSKQLWERYRIYGPDDRSFIYGFRNYPYPSTEELIEIAVKSNLDEAVEGASNLLHMLENKGFDYRETLLSNFESHASQLSKKRLEQIIVHADLNNKGNLRPTLNKTYDEIQKDMKYYQRLFERGQSLLN